MLSPLQLEPWTTGNAVLLCSTLLLGYVIFTRMAAHAKFRSLPRPLSTHPLFGNTLDLIKRHRTRIHDWFLDECLRTNGKPWLLTGLSRPPVIILTQESHFEDILKEQFDVFEKGPLIREFVKDFFGETGIFGLDGEPWRQQRKTASHLFSHHMMREIMERAIREDAQVVLDRLQNAFESNTKIEFKLLMDAFTTDAFTKIGFGVRLGCLQDDLKDGNQPKTATKENETNPFNGEFQRAFSRCPIALQARAQQPRVLWKLQRWLNVGLEKQFAQDMNQINGAIHTVIGESLRNHQQQEGADAKEKDLISLFLAKGTGGDSETETTPEMLRDMALNFISAGRGTTGQSLAWFVIMMNRYPTVYGKVLEELRRQLPQLFDLDSSSAVPTMDQVGKLVYLEAAIKESLRLNPAAPMNARTAVRDTVLRDGTFVPKGTRVMIPTYATARFPWLWGEDASEFKPERWIDDDTGKLIVVSPFKYLVFHAGPRICLGVKLALLEMKISLAAMLSKFELTTERDPFEITYEMSLSLPIQGDLFVRVHPVAGPTKPTGTETIPVTARVA